MKKGTHAIIWSFLIIFVVSCSIVHAADDSEEQVSTVTLTIHPSCQLGIVNQDVTATLVKDSNSETAFDAGYVEFEPDKPTLIVDSNKAWKLTAKSSGFTGPYSKQSGDLYLKDTGANTAGGFSEYKALSTSEQEIASYNKGVSGESHPCQYKVLLDWEKDIPGTYEATITYTLSTSGA